jgi:hypothetical protein
MLTHCLRFYSVEGSEGQFNKNCRFSFGWCYAGEHVIGRVFAWPRIALVPKGRNLTMCQDMSVKTEQ